MPEWTLRFSNSCVDAAIKVMSFFRPLGEKGGSGTPLAAPRPPASPAAPDRLTQEIKVMSFNVWTCQTGKNGLHVRKNGVLQTMLDEMPDSIGLQETHEAWRSVIKKGLRGQYAMACRKGRFFGLQEGTPIFYRKDKYDLLDEKVFWLSETPNKTSYGWDACLPRVAGYAVLRDKQTGFTYVHFNTHFDHRGEIAMANSACQIADCINEMNLPAVLTGDLNAEPDSIAMQHLTAGGLADLRLAAAETDNGSTFHDYGKQPGKIIDYVWANHAMRQARQYKVIRKEYDGRYPSDHFAVTATLTLANS